MARIVCTFEEGEEMGDHCMVATVTATCTDCGREVMSYGAHAASRRRCLAVMREECGSRNFYVDEEEG